METREEILKELKEIAPKLSAIEKRNNYSVPENYFVDFNATIVELVRPQTVAEELKTLAPGLARLESKTVHEVPSGFFEKFSLQMLRKVQQEELAETAPALASLQKVNTQQVPTAYFSTFPKQMMQRIAAEQKGAAVSVAPAWLLKVNAAVEDVIAIFFRPKYTVAFAGIASMLVIGVMFFAEVEKQCSDLDCKMAQLTNEELDAYLAVNDDFYSDEIFELNDSENQQSVTTTADEAFSKAMNSLTDEELNNAILD